MIYDVAVIGSGPGGYSAAEEAIKLGMKVILFEEHKLGGVCLNYGCIPTKALLYSAEMFYNAKNYFHLHGISFENLKFDLEKMISRSKNVINKISVGLKSLLSKAQIINSRVTSVVPENTHHEIFCDDNNTYKSKYVIIATGAKHRNIGIDGWTYKEALNPKLIPKSLYIIGSGAIGMEFACFYNALGSKVTIFEKESRILQSEDLEIAQEAKKIFEERGIEFHTERNIKQSDIPENTNVLIAAGVIPNTLNIENIKLDNMKGIAIDQNCQSNINGIYAIGDVTNTPWLAHKATRQAIIAINHIAGKKKCTNMQIPSCIYTFPQIASIGIHENESYKSIKYSLQHNGLSVAKNKSQGFVKFIINEYGEILGCHMIGDNVTEIISNIVISKSFELTIEELSEVIFPHPTLSEIIGDISRKNTLGGT